jgi:hypothetical protein
MYLAPSTFYNRFSAALWCAAASSSYTGTVRAKTAQTTISVRSTTTGNLVNNSLASGSVGGNIYMQEFKV